MITPFFIFLFLVGYFYFALFISFHVFVLFVFYRILSLLGSFCTQKTKSLLCRNEHPTVETMNNIFIDQPHNLTKLKFAFELLFKVTKVKSVEIFISGRFRSNHPRPFFSARRKNFLGNLTVTPKSPPPSFLQKSAEGEG